MKKLIVLFFLALSIFSSSIVFAMEEGLFGAGKKAGFFMHDSYFEGGESKSQDSCSSDGSEGDYCSDSDSGSDDADYDPIREEEFYYLSTALQEQLAGSVNSEDERYYIVLHLLVMLEDALENKTSKNKLEKFIQYYKDTGAQGRTVTVNLREILKSIMADEPRDEYGDISELVASINNAIRDEYVYVFSSKRYLVEAVLSYLHEKFVNNEDDLVDGDNPDISKFHKANVIQSYERWLKIPKQSVYEQNEFDAFNTACLTDYYSVDDGSVLFSIVLRALWQRYIFEQTKQGIVMESDAWSEVLKNLYIMIPDILSGDGLFSGLDEDGSSLGSDVVEALSDLSLSDEGFEGEGFSHSAEREYRVEGASDLLLFQDAGPVFNCLLDILEEHLEVPENNALVSLIRRGELNVGSERDKRLIGIWLDSIIRTEAKKKMVKDGDGNEQENWFEKEVLYTACRAMQNELYPSDKVKTKEHHARVLWLYCKELLFDLKTAKATKLLRQIFDWLGVPNIDECKHRNMPTLSADHVINVKGHYLRWKNSRPQRVKYDNYDKLPQEFALFIDNMYQKRRNDASDNDLSFDDWSVQKELQDFLENSLVKMFEEIISGSTNSKNLFDVTKFVKREESLLRLRVSHIKRKGIGVPGKPTKLWEEFSYSSSSEDSDEDDYLTSLDEDYELSDLALSCDFCDPSHLSVRDQCFLTVKDSLQPEFISRLRYHEDLLEPIENKFLKLIVNSKTGIITEYFQKILTILGIGVPEEQFRKFSTCEACHILDVYHHILGFVKNKKNLIYDDTVYDKLSAYSRYFKKWTQQFFVDNDYDKKDESSLKKIKTSLVVLFVYDNLLEKTKQLSREFFYLI